MRLMHDFAHASVDPNRSSVTFHFFQSRRHECVRSPQGRVDGSMPCRELPRHPSPARCRPGTEQPTTGSHRMMRHDIHGHAVEARPAVEIASKRAPRRWRVWRRRNPLWHAHHQCLRAPRRNLDKASNKAMLVLRARIWLRETTHAPALAPWGKADTLEPNQIRLRVL